MATVMMRARYDGCSVSGAGTHVMPGHPMSNRTRNALARHGLGDPTHRSAEFDHHDARRATVVVAMAPEHVQWVRRKHPEVAHRTLTLKRLVMVLGESGGELGVRLDPLELGKVELEEWEEVVDPAGGEQPEFDACADEISDLINLLILRLA
jgi:protein-tyrosine-phosphatase